MQYYVRILKVPFRIEIPFFDFEPVILMVPETYVTTQIKDSRILFKSYNCVTNHADSRYILGGYATYRTFACTSR